MKRVATFNKVTKEQFKKDYESTFDNTLENIDSEMYEDIILPNRATLYSAGYDFHTPFDFELKPNETIKIPTGIKCHMDSDYFLSIYVRSSIGFKYDVLLSNGTGIIDADYFYADNEGHIFIKLHNHGNKNLICKKGDAIAQGIFAEYFLTLEDKCDQPDRTGGIGSTNNNK